MIGASELIEQSISFYRKNFQRVIFVAATLAVPAAIIAIATGRLTAPSRNNVLFFIEQNVLSALLALLDFTLIIAMLFLAENPARKDLFPAIRRVAPAAVGAALLVGLITLPVSVGGSALVSLITSDALRFLAATVLLLAILLIETFFIFAVPETALGGVSWRASLRASYALVKPRVWPILWRVMVPTVFFGIAVTLLQTLATKAIAQPMILGAARVVISDFGLPLTIFALYFLYKDIKRGV